MNCLDRNGIEKYVKLFSAAAALKATRWLFMHSADMHSDYAAELTLWNACHVVEFNERCCSLCVYMLACLLACVFTDRCVLMSNSLPKNYRQINWIIYRVNTQKTLIWLSLSTTKYFREHSMPCCLFVRLNYVGRSRGEFGIAIEIGIENCIKSKFIFTFKIVIELHCFLVHYVCLFSCCASEREVAF